MLQPFTANPNLEAFLRKYARTARMKRWKKTDPGTYGRIFLEEIWGPATGNRYDTLSAGFPLRGFPEKKFSQYFIHRIKGRRPLVVELLDEFKLIGKENEDNYMEQIRRHQLLALRGYMVLAFSRLCLEEHLDECREHIAKGIELCNRKRFMRNAVRWSGS